jgi:hypothetical protein
MEKRGVVMSICYNVNIPLYSLWEAYWDADYNIINQDGYVKSWGSIKNKHRFVQNTTSARPAFNSLFDGYKQCITFDGTDDFMQANSAAFIFAGNDTAHSVAYQIDIINGSPSQTLWTASYGSSTGIYVRNAMEGTNLIRANKRGSGDGADQSCTNGISIPPIIDVATTVVYTNSGTSINFYKNGILESGFPNTLDMGDVSLINNFTLGCLSRTTQQAFANFRIRRIAVSSSVLTADQALQLHNFWNNT